MKLPNDGTSRVVVSAVRPDIDAGAYAAKRVVGDHFVVEADVFCDGHDVVRCMAAYRKTRDRRWTEVEMEDLGNDVRSASFPLDEIGPWEYTVHAWVDHFATLRNGLEKKIAAEQDVSIELLVAADLVLATAERAKGKDATKLSEFGRKLGSPGFEYPDKLGMVMSERLFELIEKYPDRSRETSYARVLPLWVDRERAGFSAWYELFPRSTSEQPGSHGTFRDCIKRLPYVASMGFDVLYLPPIHPIGSTFRKGPNNSLTPSAKDPGSPWAIGSAKGGHTAIEPQLGDEDDFQALVDAALQHKMEIALDIAFQCSPDHPWVKEHPDWFIIRPDGSVQYAENPPKKYQDIFPLNFESSDWKELWQALLGVFLYWINLGVKIFRVDNPHTKAFGFWHWVIAEIRTEHPEVLFLAEAFTRPKVMQHLAKVGYTHSYTYFTWRNTAAELQEYLTELTTTEMVEYFRPNFWPNTPDILHEDLQIGGVAAFKARLVLAATLSSNYGIYGPTYELCVNTPREAGSEEYLDSEKYQVRHWNLADSHSIAPYITAVNQLRRENAALHKTTGLRFHQTDNDLLLAYSKFDEHGANLVLVIVNFDYQYQQSGWIEFDPRAFGLDSESHFVVYDLLSDHGYRWQPGWNYVELDPTTNPAHIFRVVVPSELKD